MEHLERTCGSISACLLRSRHDFLLSELSYFGVALEGQGARIKKGKQGEVKGEE